MLTTLKNRETIRRTWQIQGCSLMVTTGDFQSPEASSILVSPKDYLHNR